jgi:hypothetical protein
MLTKSKITSLHNEHAGSLLVEVFLGSKPTRYLKIFTPKGLVVLGRVPKGTFTWFQLELMKEQPPEVNIAWYKFSDVLSKGNAPEVRAGSTGEIN